MSETANATTAEFRGYTNVEHVEQPEGSEQCFAAIISSVTGAPLHESQAALYKNGLVEDDGSTPIVFGEASFEVGSTAVTLSLPEEPAINTEDVLNQIDKQMEAGSAVALLHKKNANPGDERNHWILLTGYYAIDGQKGPYHIMDPLRDPQTESFGAPGSELPDDRKPLSMRYVARGRIAQLIRQSIDLTKDPKDPRRMKAFPEAITTNQPEPAAHAEEWAIAQLPEPEPIEDTYLATGQDKAIPLTENASA